MNALDDLLRRGTPAPLSNLETGTHAVIDGGEVTVFNAMVDQAWKVTATVQWPENHMRVLAVWAVIAPAQSGGLVLVNTRAVDYSRLTPAVRWCLDAQRVRHSDNVWAKKPDKAARAQIVDNVLSFSGTNNRVMIETPFTMTEDVYRDRSREAFEFLSPALGKAAQVINERGPISRPDLAHALYGSAGRTEMNTLAMTLSRLRRHPLIALEDDAGGRCAVRLLADGAQVS